MMQNMIPPYGKKYKSQICLGSQGISSMLGFVCKPDMPPHINILFRARPPLEYIPNPIKGKCRKYDGLLSNTNIFEFFEKEMPEEKQPEDTKSILKLKQLMENLEKNKAENRERFLKECKYYHPR
jgi:U1 small nuclear ribonucleoprotein